MKFNIQSRAFETLNGIGLFAGLATLLIGYLGGIPVLTASGLAVFFTSLVYGLR